jgi:hypothetical protein
VLAWARHTPAAACPLHGSPLLLLSSRATSSASIYSANWVWFLEQLAKLCKQLATVKRLSDQQELCRGLASWDRRHALHGQQLLAELTSKALVATADTEVLWVSQVHLQLKLVRMWASWPRQADSTC